MTNNKGMFATKSKAQSVDINSKDYLDSLYTEFSNSRTLDDLKQRIQQCVTTLGFTDFIFMRLERGWHTNATQGLLHSLPDELMRIYHENNMHVYDLMIPYGKSNTQPIFSSQVYGYIDNAPFDIDLTRKNRTLCQLYRRFEYFEHYVTPIHAFNGNGNVQLMLTNKGMDKEDFQTKVTPIMPACRFLCKAIDTVTTKNFRSSFIDMKDSPVSITPKPLSILNRLANHDISITELAKDMCISPITAHQHIAAARKALGVQTNIAAIVKAVKAGLINLD
ncbi:response regulator transcription factor [bacterium AH-315-K03]|nr:response regulator transcription factor [bacterium AH-315-K03]